MSLVRYVCVNVNMNNKIYDKANVGRGGGGGVGVV